MALPSRQFFAKYSATGNDFILFDHRDGSFDPNNFPDRWAQLCDRREGIGADGLLFIARGKNYPWKMIYLNADGKEASMCGNGARAFSYALVHQLRLESLNRPFTFETKVGPCEALVTDKTVRIKIGLVKDFKKYSLERFHEGRSIFLNTGVPHCLFEELPDFEAQAPLIRSHEIFLPEGTNVSTFKRLGPHHFFLRTFERGVEAETYSCGTAVLAMGHAAREFYGCQDQILVQTKGGELEVSFNFDFSESFLSGKVVWPFSGEFKNL